jgi:hypothetical protein
VEALHGNHSFDEEYGDSDLMARLSQRIVFTRYSLLQRGSHGDCGRSRKHT